MDILNYRHVVERLTSMGCVCLKPSVTIDGVKYRIKRQIAEGGFSTVDLIEDPRTGKLFALKRITCHSIEDQNLARKEIQLHSDLTHRNLLPLVRSATHGSADIVHNTTSDVLLVFPYFSRGTLQQDLEKRAARKDAFTEECLLNLFLGICEAVAVMHSANPPIAHRDIKPHNVLLDRDLTPVLMDLGSAAPARMSVSNMKEAQYLQDTAAERCSMPYRPPELFSVSSKCDIDERTDIWSLGCLLYAMCFYQSPFDAVLNRGDSVALAVQNSNIAIPNHSTYSDHIHHLIRDLTNVDMSFRPNIKTVIEKTTAALDLSLGSV